MNTRQRLLTVLALDFAILVAIVGGWFLFVMAGDHAVFADLGREENLKKLAIMVVAWVVLYAQHVRTTGDWSPPDPPVGSDTEQPAAPVGAPPPA